MPKLVQYRHRCIGCAVCCEMQPRFWRMSRKDGKATLLNADLKKSVYVLAVSEQVAEAMVKVAEACPVRIIKIF